MRRRTYNFMPFKFLPFLLALLLAVSTGTPGRTEAQMRCVGMASQTAPCAAMNLPAAGLSERQVSGMMACCRTMHGGMMHGCGMMHGGIMSGGMTQNRVGITAPCCLVTVRVATVRAVAPGISRIRWFLTANPALAPPPSAPAAAPALCSRPAFGPLSSPLSPHFQLRLHGLRAPPAA